MEFFGYILIAALFASISRLIYNFFELDEHGIFPPLAFALTVTLPLLIMGFIIGSTADVKTKKFEERIYSLRDNIQTEGDFILGTGSIDGRMCYTYYKKNDDLYKWGKVEKDDTFIKEGEDVTPRIVTIRKGHFNDEGWRDWFTIDQNHVKKRIIYVPKGTIIKNMKLDAK